jgi:hypothetical protein
LKYEYDVFRIAFGDVSADLYEDAIEDVLEDVRASLYEDVLEDLLRDLLGVIGLSIDLFEDSRCGFKKLGAGRRAGSGK